MKSGKVCPHKTPGDSIFLDFMQSSFSPFILRFFPTYKFLECGLVKNKFVNVFSLGMRFFSNKIRLKSNTIFRILRGLITQYFFDNAFL